MTKEALLLIDIQDVYFTSGPYLLYKPEEAALNAKAVLDHFRKVGKKVIHVKHNFKEFSDIYELVKPLPSEKLIYKDYPSAFLNTDLKEYLDENHIEKLIVAGMMSHMCVDTTVRMCQNYGYEVTVIEDACTTMDLSFHGRLIDARTVHDVFMASLNHRFAKVISLSSYLE